MQLPDHSIERHELTFQCPEKCTPTVYKNFSSFDRHLCRLHDGVTICHYDWHSFIKSETVKVISEADFISKKKGQFVKVVAKPRSEVSLTWGTNMKAQRIAKREEDLEAMKAYKVHTRKWLVEKKKKETKKSRDEVESFVLSPRIGERARRKEVRDKCMKLQQEMNESFDNEDEEEVQEKVDEEEEQEMEDDDKLDGYDNENIQDREETNKDSTLHSSGLDEASETQNSDPGVPRNRIEIENCATMAQ